MIYKCLRPTHIISRLNSKCENFRRHYHVLGIETSCDDTGVAIVNHDGHILSNCLHSQLKLHLTNGGIIPIVAKAEHLANIDPVARRAFEESKLNSVADDIDAIAVTTRPGLQFSLAIGLNYAKTLAAKYSKPLIPIHHMQAHALTPLIHNRDIKFPFITLLLSGGHCLLAIVKRFDEFHIIGKSLDEAPGDTLDKFARRHRLAKLGHPLESISGGAAIEYLADLPTSDRFKYFHRKSCVPMIDNLSCDFSFSGYHKSWDRLQDQTNKLWASGDREAYKQEIGSLCGSLQRVMLCQIIRKLYRAIKYYRMHWRYHNEDAFLSSGSNCVNAKSHFGFAMRPKPASEADDEGIDVVVSGGVAANNYFVSKLREICTECIDPGIKVHAPPKNLCNDNGLMIAWNGLLHYKKLLDEPGGNSVVMKDPSKFEMVQEEPDSPIGLDIRQEVANKSLSISRLHHKDCKIYDSYPTE